MESISSLPPLSILIVEDDTLVGKTMGVLINLKFPDVVIHIAGNGKQGVELFKEYRPDIVITDINMPEMDGMQMTCEIKRLCDGVKFIVLTGYSDKAHQEKFSKIAIADYIVKPIEFTKLFAAIDRCIIGILLERQ